MTERTMDTTGFKSAKELNMTDKERIASVVERTRKAFAAVAEIEAAITRAPTDRALQLNLSATRKLAAQSQEQLLSYFRRPQR